MTRCGLMRKVTAPGYGRPVLLPRWLDRGVPYVVDAAASVAYVVIYVAFIWIEHAGARGFTAPAWVGILLALGVGAPIAVRRRWPQPAWAVTVASLLAATALHLPLEPWVPAAIVLYTVAVRVPRRRALQLLGATVLAAVAAQAHAGGPLE
jgi:hypothetical protein